MTFDTLDYARKLEAAGVPIAQAEVQARALNQALDGSVASKADISNLKAELKADIANLELRMDARFARVEARFDARFAQVDTRFAQVDARFDQIDARFEQVDARFEQVDGRFGGLESRLSTRIEAVKTELTLDLGGRIHTLRWMLGVLVAMNATILARLFLAH